MKFGANSFIWTASFGPDNYHLLPSLKAAGLDGIELGILDPLNFAAAQVRKELQKNGLECTSCCILPPDSSLIAPEKESRLRAKAHIEACINATAESGAKLMCGPLYSPVGYFTGVRRTNDEWKYAVEGWQSLAPIAKAAGVDVAIEPLNRFETYFLNTVADAVDLCDQVNHESVGILVDTFHCNIEEKHIGTALRKAGRHLMHLHSCENDRGTPGSGNVDWPDFFSTVKDIGYDGWMVIESFGFSLGGMSAAASIWRDLASTPEDIPFEGVKFLKKELSK